MQHKHRVVPRVVDLVQQVIQLFNVEFGRCYGYYIVQVLDDRHWLIILHVPEVVDLLVLHTITNKLDNYFDLLAILALVNISFELLITGLRSYLKQTDFFGINLRFKPIAWCKKSTGLISKSGRDKSSAD